MRYLNTLASYVPSIIVKHCLEDQTEKLPNTQTYVTVCVFCDVSGFTKLSEAMALSGRGAEGLKKHLNSYFAQMNKIISGGGGDIIKFAGDAMIVLWPDSEDSMEIRCQRAAQAAIQIQRNLDRSKLEEGVELSVKIGIGVGEVTVLHIGGACGRVEYVAVGEPLVQAFAAEHHGVSGEVIVAPPAWKFVKKHFAAAETKEDGFVRLDNEAPYDTIKSSSIAKLLEGYYEALEEDPEAEARLEGRLRSYIPESALPSLDRCSREDEKWANEMRTVTVMFVNLGMTDRDLLDTTRYFQAVDKVHAVLLTAQHAVYRYGGTVNKFLMDDKGSTLIACFGLPPAEHHDDPSRAVLSALLLAAELFEFGLPASIGLTVGEVFCGITGSVGRREYTVLGDSVNLSARLMQRACGLVDGKDENTGGVICDYEMYSACKHHLAFEDMGRIKVKGKDLPIQIYRPYPRGSAAKVVAPPPGFEPPPKGRDGFRRDNVFGAMHGVQSRALAAVQALGAMDRCFPSSKARRTSDESHHGGASPPKAASLLTRVKAKVASPSLSPARPPLTSHRSIVIPGLKAKVDMPKRGSQSKKRATMLGRMSTVMHRPHSGSSADQLGSSPGDDSDASTRSLGDLEAAAEGAMAPWSPRASCATACGAARLYVPSVAAAVPAVVVVVDTAKPPADVDSDDGQGAEEHATGIVSRVGSRASAFARLSNLPPVRSSHGGSDARRSSRGRSASGASAGSAPRDRESEGSIIYWQDVYDARGAASATVAGSLQGDLEKARGLPVSFGMDRATTSQRGMAIGFGSKLVGPFYQAIAALQPDVQPCVDMLNDNVDVWTKMDA